jgi:uncharacterized protein YggT (Ycf19 family)
VPGIPLGPTTLWFRSDLLGRMFLFSLLSFTATVVIFYLWLLLLSLLNSNLAESDAQQKLIRLHLGPIERWPLVPKLVLPVVLILIIWFALNPLLSTLNIVPKTSTAHVLLQGCVIGAAVYLALKFLVLGVLLLYLLTSYVYLGEFPFWKFVDVTARAILRPFKGLPLQIGKLDTAPIVAIALVFVVAELGQRGLTHLYQKLF